MQIKVPAPLKAQDVVKRALFLAYAACGHATGMGILQARDSVTEEQVCKNVLGAEDYPGGNLFRGNKVVEDGKSSVYADYVFGRMMKVGFTWQGDEIEVRTDAPRWDYQGWCIKYKSYQELVEQAIKSLQV